MNWNEITGFRKVFFVLLALCFVAGISLTILDITGVLGSIDILEDIIDCVFWLSAGITFWKKKSLFPILCFATCGLKLICVFI